jgi:L-ascorbate metabolism protein UlaG (beta-lactamase superfamily)
MNIHFLRHATLILNIDGLKILVDPMLSPAGAMDPVANAASQRRIPLVDLPVTLEQLQALLQEIDAVLVTHTHRDHWDARAVELLPRDMPILCQPDSEAAIRAGGFASVTPIADRHQWRSIEITRTGGQHGTGEIGQKMGIVSGFVFKAAGEPLLYLAGDTVWCPEVEDALKKYQPEVVILNTGAAQFLTGDPITMSADDVCRVCRAMPSARVIAVHMEAINHCLLTRDALRDKLVQESLSARVTIPEDGALLAP